jgi:hypothetical protein
MTQSEQNFDNDIESLRNLNLEDLSKGLPGVTEESGKVYLQQISVCLDNQNHNWGVTLTVLYKEDVEAETLFRRKDATIHKFTLPDWLTVTDQMQRNHGQDLPYTCEQAAYGIAFLLILELTDYTIIRKSVKTTGVDWYLGFKNDPNNLFQDAGRLEVSGLLYESANNTLRSRAKIKLKQTSPTDSKDLPVYVIISEFGKPEAWVMKKWIQ